MGTVVFLPFDFIRVPLCSSVVSNTQNALLELRGLTVELPTAAGWIRPVHDVSLALAAGETLALVGESGSGKTMLALAVMGLLPPGARVNGAAHFVANGAGVNLFALASDEMRRLRGREVAMIFQEPMTALNPVMRVGAQIAEAVRVHQPGLARGEAQRRVVQALTRAAVPEPESRARQFPHQLSGGLRQRAMIAMALASGATEQRNGGLRLLIADEPTTALDVTVQKQILELLARLQAELGLALLFITHDLGVAAQIARRIAVMYAGRIVEEGPAETVLRAPLHPYTHGLLRAAPRLTSRKLEPIPGTVPQLHALPPGCAFEPRCAVRRAECAKAVPEMRRAAGEHRARCVLVSE
jgi:oligopeptide/dipeptide ABC transporter ATP-binding protein